MNAEQERAFDLRGHAVGRALWPDEVKIAGIEFPAVVVSQPVQLDYGAAGVQSVAGVRVEILKTDLADCPAVEVPLWTGGKTYTIKETAGHGATESAWYLVCAQFSK